MDTEKRLTHIKACPLCTSDALRVIYYGLPVWVCSNDRCSLMWGFWSWLTLHLPFNGVLFAYNYLKMSYPVALYHWLKEDAPHFE